MQDLTRKLFGLFGRGDGDELEPASLASDDLVYAIGDIHGRHDLLQSLLESIHEDARAAGLSPTLVFLGDYIDRGPSSRQVVDSLIELSRSRSGSVVFLKGNHEDGLLRFLADPETGPLWARHGGRETLVSYGVSPPARADAESWLAAGEAFSRALPPSHLEFYRSLSHIYVDGDYVFVHAGIRPGVPLEDQDEHDLLWIRHDFLDHAKPSDGVVVHGHTVSRTPHVSRARIGLDTGAFASGILTALRLQGDQRSFLQTKQREVLEDAEAVL